MSELSEAETFFVDGRLIGPEECRALFSGPMSDRARKCLAMVEGKSIIDIGCYSGQFVRELIASNPEREAFGLGYTEEHIGLARFLYPEIGHRFRQMSVYGLNLPNCS